MSDLEGEPTGAAKSGAAQKTNCKPKTAGAGSGAGAAANPTSSYNPNLLEDDDDAELIQKSRGDAVGDTLYSQRFILKTIVELSKLENNLQENEQLETDLCSLWDMTIERDVIQFLLHEDALDLFAHVIENTEDFRLIEILVGILANMCFNERAFKELTRNIDAVEILLKLTSCMDTLIIVQLMRLLEIVMTHLRHEENAEDALLWYQYFSAFDVFAERFGFILKMCIDENLLKSCMKTLNTILAVCAIVTEKEEQKDKTINDATIAEADANVDVADKAAPAAAADADADTDANADTASSYKLETFEEVFVHKDLIDGTYNAFMHLMRHVVDDERDKVNGEDYELWSDATNEIMQVYINIHTILAQYETSNKCYEPHKQQIIQSLALILLPMCDPKQLLPLSEQHESYLNDIKHICECLGYPFHATLFLRLHKIWSLIQVHLHKLTNDKSSTVNDFESDMNDLSLQNYTTVWKTLLHFLANLLKQRDAKVLSTLVKLPRKALQTLYDAIDTDDDKTAHNDALTNLRNALETTHE